jgi:hypothetical protein
MMDRRVIIPAVAAISLGVIVLIFHPRPAVETKLGSIPHDVYVWQRSWSPAVCAAVREHGQSFGEIVVLAAEVSWKNGEPKVARVRPDADSLRAASRGVGVAIRVGAFDGPKTIDPFDPAGKQSRFVCDLAAESIERLKRDSIEPAELQIDFDCPESKLAGYRKWIVALKKRVAPVPVSITSLPSWLDAPAFAELARECGSYVLQVHSLRRPTSTSDVSPLCEVRPSQAWVEQAEKIGVPFRVALPTYAYVASFDTKGKFLKLAAEGSNLAAPSGGSLREIDSDPRAISELVRGWVRNRPAHLRSIIWYRLPNDNDELNWRWPTLAAVMEGRTPQARLFARARKSEPNLFEIEIANDGEADAPISCRVKAQCAGAKILASDGVEGFERASNADSSITLRADGTQPRERLAPGEKRTVGWVRTSREAEVRADVSPLP